VILFFLSGMSLTQVWLFSVYSARIFTRRTSVQDMSVHTKGGARYVTFSTGVTYFTLMLLYYPYMFPLLEVLRHAGFKLIRGEV
jgi:hypothetical protein